MDFSKYGIKRASSCESCAYYDYDEYTEHSLSHILEIVNECHRVEVYIKSEHILLLPITS